MMATGDFAMRCFLLCGSIALVCGLATMTDPSGRTYYNVPMTQGYQWVKNGQTMQTNSSAPPPGGGWRPLKQAPSQ